MEPSEKAKELATRCLLKAMGEVRKGPGYEARVDERAMELMFELGKKDKALEKEAMKRLISNAIEKAAYESRREKGEVQH